MEEIQELSSNLNKLVTQYQKEWLSGLAKHLADEFKLDEEDVVESALKYGGDNVTVKKQTVKDRIPEKHRVNISKSDRIVLVLNYGRSNALFGDFKDKYKDFRVSVLSVNKSDWNLSYNQNLALGPGWMIDRSHIRDLKKALKKHELDYEVVEFEDIVSGKKSFDDESIEEVKEKSTKMKLNKNKYGNYHDKGTNIVFAKLPIGKNGSTLVAIGTQNTTKSHQTVKGFKSVDCLSDKDEKVCKKKGWKMLSEDIIDKVDDVDSELADSLRSILIEYDESDDESDDDSSLGSGIDDD